VRQERLQPSFGTPWTALNEDYWYGSTSNAKFHFLQLALSKKQLHQYPAAYWKRTLAASHGLISKRTHDSVIYVSLGSIASMDKKELAELAWGLASSKQPFLWVVRNGKNHCQKVSKKPLEEAVAL
jgi:hypothetical protein